MLIEELESRLVPAVITTIAGNGANGYNGDGIPATSAMLYLLFATAVDSNGNVFIADTYNNRIREVLAGTGNIVTFAGTGNASFYGDGGPAICANVARPNGVAVDRAGNVYIADTFNNRVREVVAATGNIITIAGNGTTGFGGDGGPATTAKLNSPVSSTVDASGNVFFADQGNNRIREIIKQDAPHHHRRRQRRRRRLQRRQHPRHLGRAQSAQRRRRRCQRQHLHLGLAQQSHPRSRQVDRQNHHLRRQRLVRLRRRRRPGHLRRRSTFPAASPWTAGGNVYIADSSNERIREVVEPAASSAPSPATASWASAATMARRPPHP